MSMLGTLGKVAMGIMVARTVGSAMGGSSGIGNMLGGLLGGSNNTNSKNPQQGNALPNLINSLGGSKSGGLGDLLSSALSGNEVTPTPNEEEQAKILLKAMINAAICDGKLDEQERTKILSHAKDASPQELAMVKELLQNPQTAQEFAKEIPADMAQQVYFMSIATINLDTKEEAQYLDTLAKELNISPEMANEIHEKIGAPKLYS